MGKEYGILQILNRIFDYTNSLIRAGLAGNVVSEVTLQNAATANDNGTPITLDGNASLVVQITGTFVGTINFEATQDGTNYVGILGQNVNTGGQETSATAPGIFVFSVNGLNKFRARISGYTSGSITVKAAAIAVPLAGLSSATINATVDAVKVKDATGTYTWNIGSDGAGPVQLTGSNVTDSQALPMTQAQKDIVAKAVDNIIDTIGVENILLFLCMWETSGTKAYDLLKKNLTFTINGATLAQQGPFGYCMSFDGVNDYLVQDPITENTYGSSDAILPATGKLATRMAKFSGYPTFVRLKLKRVGTLSSATVKVSIYTDNSGVPGSLITDGESATLACSDIGTSYRLRGFTFSTSPTITQMNSYWLVLEYADATGVDESNYITWCYETGANNYGEARSVYDGSNWTTTSGENHVFGVWDNHLALLGDFSFIATHKLMTTSTWKYVIYTSGMINNEIVGIGRDAEGWRFGINYGTGISSGIKRNLYNIWSVSAGTFSVASSTNKVKYYSNGKFISSVSGTADAGQIPPAQPFAIGACTKKDGTQGIFFQGLIGPAIITSNELTAAQVAKISHNLLVLRKFGVEV